MLGEQTLRKAVEPARGVFDSMLTSCPLYKGKADQGKHGWSEQVAVRWHEQQDQPGMRGLGCHGQCCIFSHSLCMLLNSYYSSSWLLLSLGDVLLNPPHFRSLAFAFFSQFSFSSHWGGEDGVGEEAILWAAAWGLTARWAWDTFKHS